MESSLKAAIVLWLSFACLWARGSAQDLDALKSKLQELNDREELFADGVLRHRLSKVKQSIEENFDTFWPPNLDVLEQLAQGNGSGSLTAECINGTIRLLQTTDPVIHLPLILRMVDAMGKIGAGYFDGNFYATGAYDECMDIGPGYAEYCTGSVSLAHIPLPMPLSYGLCVPRGCTPEDVVYAVEAVTFRMAKLNASTVHCESIDGPPLSAGAIVMILVCCIFATLVTAATTFDFVVQQIQALTTKHEHGNIQEDNSSDKLSEKAPLLTSKSLTTTEQVQPLDLVTSFSLLKVIPQILSTKQPPSAITSINGLRVMSMFWVILCHTYFWVLLTGVDNILILKSVASRFAFQAIANAFFSVDTFFFLSGLLVAYLSMREMKRKNGRFPFLMYYLHRYLRLTPTYAFVLFFIWFLLPYLGNGPSYHLSAGEQSTSYQNCEKYWWTNLIYINNLYPWSMEDECIGWTWYLANDMQFYIFTPLILIPMYFLYPIGLAICAVVLAGCFIISGSLAGVYDLQANELAQYAYGYNDTSNTSPYTSFQNLLYVKPWHRVAPYIVGLILGYVLYRFRLSAKRPIYYIVFGPLLVISGLCLFWTLYGLYFTWHGHVPTLAENVIYIMFSRSIWALGLALLVFACHYGYGGIINLFLSMKFWIPLSRISYNAYLLHPLILTVIFASERKTIHYQDYNLVIYAIGAIVLSYGAAAVVSVFVEFPVGNLEQTLFKMVGLGRRESVRTGGEGHKNDGKQVLNSPLHSKPVT